MTSQHSSLPRCIGTIPRRSFLRAGLVGWSTLGLVDLLRTESVAAQQPRTARTKSMILLWLWGGPSHMETFDLKPNAPPEFRGEFDPIATSVPGLQISEHLPRIAALGDQFALVRSVSHDSPGHVNSTHTLMTGYPGAAVEMPPYAPDHPDLFAVAGKMLGSRVDGMPPLVSMPRMRYQGGAYLGSAQNPFLVTADPSTDKFSVPNTSLSDITRPQFSRRLGLLNEFDQFRRDVDTSGMMESLDEFQQKAVSMLTGEAARKAFDIGSEDPRIRDRYGRHAVGQRCLLARRLVEAGSRIVSIDFPTVPGQKAFSWDDHASVWNIFEQMKIRLPVLDQVVSALIEDIHARGLQDDVLLVVMGEMSHTPRLSNFKGQPGREHWGRTMSVFLSGGGMPMGQAVGETNHKGDEVLRRLVTPNDLLATWYKHLGVPLDIQFPDHAGRPTPILPDGQPIRELI